MNQKLKQVGLFAVLAVFTLSLTTSLVSDVEATSKYDNAETSPVEPSSKAAHMADLMNALRVGDDPSLQQIRVNDSSTKAGTEFVVTGDVTTFKVSYFIVNPAGIDLRNVEILVTSDTESVEGEILGNYSTRNRILTVQIDAVDPASVDAKIIGWS